MCTFLSELLKIAEKKQFEPIVIEPKEKKDEERPLTKKQKKEMEREREWRERKEGKIPQNRPQDKPTTAATTTTTGPVRIPKINGASTEIKTTKPTNIDTNRILKENSAKTTAKINGISTKVSNDVLNKQKTLLKQPSEKSRTDYLKQALMKKQEIPTSKPVKLPERQPSISTSSKPLPKIEKKPIPAKSVNDNKPKKFPSEDLRPRQFPPKDLKPKQFPPADLKPKQFPPPDVKRRPVSHSDLKKKPVKRRILDDDEEYDSEMDDFIDDGPEESEDYSKYISEIFGYDKSKYRHVDDDDHNMESSFSQQLKEEYISAKIGTYS